MGLCIADLPKLYLGLNKTISFVSEMPSLIGQNHWKEKKISTALQKASTNSSSEPLRFYLCLSTIILLG